MKSWIKIVLISVTLFYLINPIGHCAIRQSMEFKRQSILSGNFYNKPESTIFVIARSKTTRRSCLFKLRLLSTIQRFSCTSFKGKFITGNLTLIQPADIRFRSLNLTGTDTASNKIDVIDPWWSPDKFQHFFFSMGTSIWLFQFYYFQQDRGFSNSGQFAMGFTLGLGLGKEFVDSTRLENKFSYKDLIWDILGISAGYLVYMNDFEDDR